MWEINENATRNDFRVGSGDGTIIVQREFSNEGIPTWKVVRNVYSGHPSSGKSFARNCKSFAEARAIAEMIAPTE